MAGRKPANPAKPVGFASLDSLSKGKCPDCLHLKKGEQKNHSHGICPDCLDRNALRIDGSPITFGGQLRGATQDVGRGSRSKSVPFQVLDKKHKKKRACETCLGTGSVPLYGKARNDPYADNGWLVRDAVTPGR